MCTPSANNLPRPLVRNYRLGWGTVGKKVFRFITQTGNIETREVTSRRKKKKKKKKTESQDILHWKRPIKTIESNS